MSVQAISWALKQRVGNGTAKLLLVALANYADADGRCWPSQATLAAECEVSIRSVREYLLRLEMVGMIEREERRRADGTRTSDVIALKISGENNQAENPAASDQAAGIAAGSTGKIRMHQPADSAGHVRDKLLLEPTKEEPSPIARASAAVRGEFDAAYQRWPKFRASNKAKAWERWKRIYDPNLKTAIDLYLQSPDALKPDRESGKPHAYVPAFEVWLNGKAAFWLERVGDSAAEAPVQLRPDQLARLQAQYLARGEWRDEWGPIPEPDLFTAKGA